MLGVASGLGCGKAMQTDRSWMRDMPRVGLDDWRSNRIWREGHRAHMWEEARPKDATYHAFRRGWSVSLDDWTMSLCRDARTCKLPNRSRIAIHHHPKLTLARPSSAPILATIFILFGIGYTIDYNSKSSAHYETCGPSPPILTTLPVSSLFFLRPVVHLSTSTPSLHLHANTDSLEFHRAPQERPPLEDDGLMSFHNLELWCMQHSCRLLESIVKGVQKEL